MFLISHEALIVPTLCVTAIKLSIFPFALNQTNARIRVARYEQKTVCKSCGSLLPQAGEGGG